MNTGNELGDDGAEDAVTATQQVFHDAARPSALVLPVAITEEEGNLHRSRTRSWPASTR